MRAARLDDVGLVLQFRNAPWRHLVRLCLCVRFDAFVRLILHSTVLFSMQFFAVFNRPMLTVAQFTLTMRSDDQITTMHPAATTIAPKLLAELLDISFGARALLSNTRCSAHVI